MSEAHHRLGKLLLFACAVEIGTGLALLGFPGLVALALLGSEPSASAVPLGRFFGIALIALGLACWPSRQGAFNGLAAWKAMLTYNLLVAVYLTWLATVAGMSGLLLWPAVLLHGIVALALIRLRAGSTPMQS